MGCIACRKPCEIRYYQDRIEIETYIPATGKMTGKSRTYKDGEKMKCPECGADYFWQRPDEYKVYNKIA